MQIQNQENMKNQEAVMRMPSSKKSNYTPEQEVEESELSTESSKTVETAAPAPGEESAP